MPKKTPETETVDTMDLELSTSGQNVDTTDSMTENEPLENLSGNAEEIVEKSRSGDFAMTETEEAADPPGDGVESSEIEPAPITETEEAVDLPQASEDASKILATEPVLQEAPEPKPRRARRGAIEAEQEPVF